MLIWNKQKTSWYDSFQNKTHVMNLALLSKIELNEKVLKSLIGLFRSSKFVSREEFFIFTESIIENQSFIHALEWVPKVVHSKRFEFEEQAKLEGLVAFQFSERLSSGEMIRAENREVYYPVYYVHPLERNKLALGFDLFSNPIRAETLKHSIDTGNIESSSSITLVQENKSGPGFLIFYPNYRGKEVPETLSKRREMFEGFALGVYLIEELIEDVMQGEIVPGLNMVIYENNVIDEENRLYGNLMENQEMELSFPINVSGRTWLLVWQADDKFNGGLSINFPLVASGGFFVLMIFLAMIFEMNLMKTKAIEQEVKIRTAELKRANRDLEQFANITSHDLKAPLRGINHLSNWIQEDLGENLPAEVRGHLDRLAESVEDMDALIQGILEYSKAGKSSIERRTVNVEGLIKKILSFIDISNDVELVVQNELPIFQTDYVKLSQIFSNLISNAIKHNTNSNKRLSISSKTKGLFYEFRVEGNGPGIDPKYYDKIFQMFQTLQRGSKVENTGIGLPIVKKLVEEANGFIRVEPVKEGGTAFVFSWPVNVENAG
ncbi:MAG: hypothetical protein HOK41_14435 [Nitrospina sp.]|nr:hypothetical protein [Nitrospina sp.]MBT6718905.1 hypothetical protein [Nitrospina sp.]